MKNLIAVLFTTLVATSIFAEANVVPFIHTSIVKDDRTMEARAVLINDRPDLARDVQLRVTFPVGVRPIHIRPAFGWAFRWDDGTNFIDIWSIGLDGGASDAFDFTFRVDESIWGDISLTATSSAIDVGTLTARSPAVVAERLIRVTSDADSGPGSFREVIATINEGCDGSVPCHVKANPGLAPVVLQSPLPPITATNTNIEGQLDIDGGLLAAGNGIELKMTRSQGIPLTLSGILVHDFPGNGFEVTSGGDVEANYVLQWCKANANGNRGISIANPRTTVRLRDNEISHNGRTGVVVNGAMIFQASGNVIAGNGASGIFVIAARYASGSGNTIQDHPDFGIAVAKGQKMSIVNSKTKGNRALDVDFGLDGPTPNDEDESDGLVNTPIITEAVFDSARFRTVVTGILRTSAVLGENFYVNLYVGREVNSFGIANSEGFVSTRVATGRLGGEFEVPFTFEIESDLRGALLSAQTQVWAYEGWTSGETTVSEISGAFRVR